MSLDFESLLEAHQHPDFFFVQIGAHDGISGGDPIHEYVLHYRWHGVLVEPLPDVFQQLIVNYETQPQLRFENAALTAHDGEVGFYRHPTSTDCSGLGVITRIQKKSNMGLITVPCLTWQTLCERHKIEHIDLLQIDVEGYDLALLRLINFSPKPSIIRFEFKNLPKEDLVTYPQFLATHGYQVEVVSKKDAVAWLPKVV